MSNESDVGEPGDQGSRPHVHPGHELRRLRQEQGVSLAKLGERIHYTKGYLSRVETGDKPLTPAVAGACDAALGTGGLLGRLAVAFPDQRRRANGDECPYRGLAPYQAAHASWFFGRERATAALVRMVTARLDGGGPAVVVAASGTGKSSLLHAGLVPALYRKVLPVSGSHRWPVLAMCPGEQPVSQALMLMADAVDTDPGTLRTALEEGPRQLARAVHELVAPEGKEGARLVLVVDQFEEAFTLCEDTAERTRFIRVLHALSTVPDDPRERQKHPAALVVLGVRADFYGSCLVHPELAAALRNGQLPLEPMCPGEIREAVTKPAEAAGLELEPGLVEVILRDLGSLTADEDHVVDDGPGGPGVLPLLSHALLTTWQERDGTRLTVGGYERAGGIVGAVSATAEGAYGRLSADRKEAARAVLLRLVRVDEDGRATRRHAGREEHVLGVSGQAGEVVEEFTRARLLTADRGQVTLAHESVLRAWPRLRGWIDADAASLRAWQRMSETAGQWQAEDRDPTLLPRGSRLAAAKEAAGHPLVLLGETERAFLRAAEAQDRAERRRERRRTRRLHQLLVALVVLLVMALVSTATAVRISREAIAGQRMARLNEKLALLAVPSTAANAEANMLLAASAWATARSGASASGVLSTQAAPYTGSLKGHAGFVRAVAWAGDHLVSGGADGTVRIWNSRSRREVRRIDQRDAVRALAVAPETGALVWGDQRGGLTMVKGLGAREAPLPFRHDGRVTGLAASEDGRTVLSVGDDGVLAQLDLTSRDVPVTRTGLNHPLYSVAVTPDGGRAAVAGAEGRLWLVDPAGGTSVELETEERDAVWALAFSRDGSRLFAGAWDGDVTVWNTRTRRVETTLVGLTDSVVDLTVSPDGHQVAASGHEDVVAVWDLSTHRLLTTLVGHQGFVWGAEYAPDGRSIATGGEDGTVRLWTPTSSLGLLEGSEPWLDGALSPDGSILGIAGGNGTARFVDQRSGNARRLPSGNGAAVRAVAFSDDGAHFAAADEQGDVSVWRTSDPRRPVTEWRAHRRTIRSLAFRPGHRDVLAVAGDDHVATLWKLPAGAGAPVRSHQLSGHADGVHSIVFLDENTVVTGSLDHEARLWNYSDSRLLRRLRHGSLVLDLAAGPGGVLASTGWDDTVKIWDRPLGTGRPRTLTGHTGPVNTVAFNRTGTRLATAGRDHTVRVWSTADGRLLHTLRGHQEPIRAVAFMSDDGPVVSVAEDGTIRRWSLDTEAVLRDVCRAVGSVDRATWQKQLPGVPFEPGCR
ncbi:helix-turn-helix domain-containing protein [Streptomyces sp. NPDC005794]|uniref:nSTAND1 domain-containing NTPase n=1 Tax=Streptomyces sp. NPDC005794 TaxID=3364733 RepID=UPI0036832D20